MFQYVCGCNYKPSLKPHNSDIGQAKIESMREIFKKRKTYFHHRKVRFFIPPQILFIDIQINIHA